MWYLKITTVLVIVVALCMMKKESDKPISKRDSTSSLHEIQKKCTLQNCLSL